MSLEEVFDLATIDEPPKEEVILKEITDNGVVDDFDKSRKDLHAIVNIGSKAIEELGTLAKQSQDPDHYNALSSLIKNVSEASSTLLKLHQLRGDIIRPTILGDKSEYHQTLNYFASTKELADALKEISFKDVK